MWVETHKQHVPAGRALALTRAVHLCQVNIYIRLDLFIPTAAVISRGTVFNVFLAF